jgi:hypothetical protein
MTGCGTRGSQAVKKAAVALASAVPTAAAVAAVPSPTRSRALVLYRDLMRVAKAMPTENRRAFVRTKARAGFARDRGKVGDEAEAAVAVGEVLLEQARAQATHLTKVFNDPRQHGLG